MKAWTMMSLGAAFVVGLSAGIYLMSGAEEPAAGVDSSRQAVVADWTCPMHPAVSQPSAGDCPICGMDLVPRDEGGIDPGPRRVALTAAAVALAEVETAVAERRFVTRKLRLVGKLDFDETRLRSVSARVPGRLERLFVDYTGVNVRAGDHLVSLFSPELETAQQELIEASRRLDTEGERSGFLAESDRRAYQAAREKLREWGMGEPQIDAVEAAGEAEDRIQVDSPLSGVVIEKYVDEGDYVQTGTRLYRIAELDRLWVRIEAYERDLAWLRFGQRLSVTTEAWPGEVFEGRLSFIDPTVDERSRTIAVRVNVDNADGRLKPGMFVRAEVEVRLAARGAVLDPALAGKWISPMHPEVVKDGPGQCDVCGMDLVPAESLGFVAGTDDEPPLVVPATAVLPTGRRALVFVEVSNAERPTYEGREVVLGPRAGDDQVITAGLEAGERVVVRGAFQIDSALQLAAKPSMIDMPAGVISQPADRVPVAAAEWLQPLVVSYLALWRAAAGDDFAASREAARSCLAAGEAVARAELSEWSMGRLDLWRDAAQRAAVAEDLAALRVDFEPMSKAVLALVTRHGHDPDLDLRESHCPMAFDDRGASWLQSGDELLNPYFGAEMLHCGWFERELPAEGLR